jgi:regulation of enolase protein 1 (concanavalin A-like superfamily)
MSSRSTAYALLLAAVATGCAEGDAPPEGEAGAPPVPGPFDAFRFRREISVTAGTPAGYSIALVFDHAALVAEEKSEADASDLVLAYDDGTELAEIDRVLEPTSEWNSASTVLWFRTGGDGAHFLYYDRRGGTGAPKADPAAVFDFFDDFEGNELAEGWNGHFIGGATGDVVLDSGAARLRGISGDIGGTSDNFSFFARDVEGDFVVDVAIRGAGASLGAMSKVGGVMVRQSPLPDARFVMLAGQQTPGARVRGVRDVDGNEADLTSQAADIPYPQLYSVRRHGDELSVSYSDDAITWIGVGQAAAVELLDPVLVGVPLANLSGGTGHVDTEYFRVRASVLPAPKAELGDEQAQ